jgi:hypothetical protein
VKRGRLAQREVGLLAVALLAVAVSIAITMRERHKAAASVLPPEEGAYTALVAASGPRAVGSRTGCGVVIGTRTFGISSPVLPCGVRLYLTYRSRHVLASVIGRGPEAPGAEFALTPALAHRLGVTGVKRLRWSYAGQP